MVYVNVQVRVENNYTEDIVVVSQAPEVGNATQKLPDSIQSGGGRGTFLVSMHIAVTLILYTYNRLYSRMGMQLCSYTCLFLRFMEQRAVE